MIKKLKKKNVENTLNSRVWSDKMMLIRAYGIIDIQYLLRRQEQQQQQKILGKIGITRELIQKPLCKCLVFVRLRLNKGKQAHTHTHFFQSTFEFDSLYRFPSTNFIRFASFLYSWTQEKNKISICFHRKFNFSPYIFEFCYRSIG